MLAIVSHYEAVAARDAIGAAGPAASSIDVIATAVHEDLVSLACRAAELAPLFCGDCIDYHRGWPALRLIEAHGLESDRPYLIPLFRELLREAPRYRWLIPGLADTGLLATVGAAIWADMPAAEITLIDRCETPLMLCREFADRLGRNLNTIRVDFGGFVPNQPQDVIFAHSVLSHLEAPDRLALIRSFREWLDPSGCLVLAVRLDDQLHPDDIVRQASPGHLETIVDALRSCGIADNALAQQLATSIQEDLKKRIVRRGAYATLKEITAALNAGGFPEVQPIVEYVGPQRRIRPAGRSQKRAILVARRGKQF